MVCGERERMGGGGEWMVMTERESYTLYVYICFFLLIHGYDAWNTNLPVLNKLDLMKERGMGSDLGLCAKQLAV